MTNAIEPSGNLGSPTPASAQAWRWRLEDAAGREVSPAGVTSPEFPSQSDAESWVGEIWRDLLDGGVDAVTLFEGDRQVYGPMSLHA